MSCPYVTVGLETSLVVDCLMQQFYITKYLTKFRVYLGNILTHTHTILFSEASLDSAENLFSFLLTKKVTDKSRLIQ